MTRFRTYLFAITCAAILVSACNPLDVDTPRDTRIENPDPDFRPARTVSLMWAIDASKSMVNDEGVTDMERTIEGARTVMNFLYSQYDLAGLTWFNRDLYSIPTTNNFYRVGAAMDDIQTTTDAYLWDGGYLAVQELLKGEPRDVMAVILVTDGGDDNSKISLDSLGHFANMNRVVIYTVGLGAAADSASLDKLAKWTDGIHKSYDKDNADSEPLSAVFKDILFEKIRQKP